MSGRLDRINEELQRELSELLRSVKDPRVHGLLSITHVETTGDLRYAKIYVSILDKNTENDVIKGLKSASAFLRREIGKRINLRYTPELIFETDDSIRHGAHINELLSRLEKEEQ